MSAESQQSPSRHHVRLDPSISRTLRQARENWRHAGNTRKLWNRDPAVWTGADEAEWLGWLDVARAQAESVDRFESLADTVRGRGFRQAVLLGMGGSSLCAEVMARTLPKSEGSPAFSVLDTTDPEQIRHARERFELGRTLFIVSSKSGTTLETRLLYEYFFDAVSHEVGSEASAARQFAFITDPGSALEQEALQRGSLGCFHGIPSIGGRFSALSDFGMVPAAIMGAPVRSMLTAAYAMQEACGPDVADADNPGVDLGLVLAVAAGVGRDKVTVVTSPGLGSFGAWLEQLLAESTGKRNRVILPIDGEPWLPPEAYGSDRLFVHLRLGAGEPGIRDALAVLAASGHAVVEIGVPDPTHLGAEFFRWELATAVAGSLLELNPFDQPDVEAAKIAAKKLVRDYEERGELSRPAVLVQADGLSVAVPEPYGSVLQAECEGTQLHELLRAHLRRLGPGRYFAILAFIEQNEANAGPLHEIRQRVAGQFHCATTVGFGPRYLHSTGQAHKGGPNAGVFIQIVRRPQTDVEIPGKRYGFGVVQSAQAQGDLQVLASRDRPVIQVRLGSDVERGLQALAEATDRALAGHRIIRVSSGAELRAQIGGDRSPL